MKTTSDFEDDVLQAPKEIAQREGGTAGKIISSRARHGLAASSKKSKKKSVTRGGVSLLPSRGELVTLKHVQQLMDPEGV